MKEAKSLSVTDISKLIGISFSTIYKVLKEHLGYILNRLVKATQRKKKQKILNKLTFDSKNLTADYVIFNFEQLNILNNLMRVRKLI